MRRLINLSGSIILLIVAISFLDWDNLKSALLRVNPWVFTAATLIALSQFIAMGIRWYYIIFKIVPLPLSEHMRKYLYSAFLNSFTPANLGGDMYRLFQLRSKISSHVPIIIALLRERLLGLLSFFLVYLLFLLALWARNPLLMRKSNVFSYSGEVIVTLTAAILILPYLLSRISKLSLVSSRARLTAVAANLYEATSFNARADFVKLIGLSVLSLFIWILTVQVVALDLSIRVSLSVLAVVVILVELARLLPLNIQGIGLREGAFAYLFHVIGESPEAGFALGTVSYLALSISIILSGIIGRILSSFSPETS
jgi:uncharacterized protein (TIRG00374 family)